MITKRQKQVLNFVVNFSEKKGYSPSLEEIKKNLKLSSVSTIHYHVEKLLEEGYLEKEKNHSRTVYPKKIHETIEIPLLGIITAGQPIEAIETMSQTIVIPKNEIKSDENVYALKVQGDSMIDDGIYDGDVVVIKKQEYADDGQTVVAIIDENEATLKKIFREKNRIRLQPSNPNMLPLYRDEVEIRGVVVKVIRNFQTETKTEDIKRLDYHPSIDTGNKYFIKNKFDLNNIYNMDCIDLMQNIKDNSIDLIFADPPYNLSKSNFKMKFVKSGGTDLNTNKGKWDYFTDEDFETFTKKWLKECYRILKKTGAIWVAGTYHNIYLTGYILRKLGFEILNEILWHKTDATPNLSCTRFVADHENFIWARKDKQNTFNYKKMKIMNANKQMRSIWPKGKTAGGKKVHPTQKPEWLLERIILATSKPNDVVFDPFMGSGTTAVVAKKYKRNYLGSERDINYYKQSLQRLKQTNVCNIII
ncbi:MAG: transcriptional repressor LexA [Candidatus Falkowbacteria bacterium]